MKCQQLLKALNEYVEGQIDPAVCQELEKHLADCNPCRIVVDTLRKTISLYKEGEVYELPADFKERLHQALKDKWRQRPAEGKDQPK
jgi:anti-sigma factor RsiW